jgi:GT2 family glycosyltransferase
LASHLDRHVVTAVLVAHDGARWLPETLKALLTQSHRVDRIIAADTGSADAGTALLTEVVGAGNLLTLPERTPYAEAVARSLTHPGATAEVPVPDGASGADRTEWIWLLHDDSSPAHDALERLLRTADSHPPAAILGPKLRDWNDRRVLLETGVAIDRTGRRETGLDGLEFDQGQHDTIREVMAVSTAGMLVRRDVWDELGGLDPEFGLFRDDVDLGWRAYAAGHRVLLAPDAVVYHAEAAARGARVPSVPADDRRSALLVLFANLPLSTLVPSLVVNLILSLLRACFFAVRKRPGVARAELRALRAALARAPRMRRTRTQGLTHSGVRRFQPRWPTLRRLPELISGHRVPLPTPESGALRRWLRRPAVLMALALTLVALVAERALLATGGRVGGGPLLPAWGGASDLWAEYTSGWHPVGLGSATGAPPYSGALAVLSTLLLGKPWLAVMVLLVGAVPLAGLAAYSAARRLLRAGTPLAIWAGVTYSLLPVGTGAVTTGRVGTSVAVILLPPIGAFAYDMFTGRSRNAAWVVALMLTAAMAFAPVTWVLAVLVGAPAAYALGGQRRGARRRAAIAFGAPPLLLLPWSCHLLAHPSGFLREAGLTPDAVSPAPSTLLMLGPGGPGAPAVWTTAGLAATALAALLLPRRRAPVLAGWLIALAGLLAAILVIAAAAWPGVPLMFAAAGVVLAAAIALRRALGVLSGRDLVRRAAAAAVAVAAISTPVVTAGVWMLHGGRGPLVRAHPDAYPLVIESRETHPRLLVLSQRSGGPVTAAVLRERQPLPGEETARPPSAARDRLRSAVARLASGSSGASALAPFGIRYLFVPHPDQDPLAAVLDAVPDLTRLSRTRAFALWELTRPAGRLVLLDGGTATPLAGGRMDAQVNIPPGRDGRTLLLAEPASEGWHATIDGRAPRSSTLDGWAQGFEVPSSGGVLRLSRGMRLRHLWVCAQGLGLVVVALLALPSAVERPLRPRGRHAMQERPQESPVPSVVES